MAEPSTFPETIVTESVVRDLLPLYFDGEASEDTRALVEAWFAARPDLALAAGRGERAIEALAGLDGPARTPAEVRAELERIRRMVLVREVAQGLAGALTLLPLLGIALYLLLPGTIPVAVPNALIALVAWFVLTIACWGLYIRSRRQSRSDLLDGR
ncbi:MAG TPA: zf-HC2 domain-containing protein [Allosphingosinicella sp.]|nr:zf-HC2 domain-containing protein [Allosphingosinicella sp.]